MYKHESSGSILASLLAKYDMSLEIFCLRSGLSEYELHLILDDMLMVTPLVAEKLGRVFYTPGFWIVSAAMLELRKLIELKQC
ncbi:XRE family transcriptional regulator [[Curtobacterium] plantarum]|uniref:XRE family transcriptional regulator n=1 Tax=[Curtobacterium] plantarum TaxID=221276 RepID=UPI000F098DEF|nr:XRE family transcriptional regulator [[Curtobacterium] plantarum]RNA72314.1 XRE family transcriptional regulator [[Curtobacterium] plantarum]